VRNRGKLLKAFLCVLLFSVATGGAATIVVNPPLDYHVYRFRFTTPRGWTDLGTGRQSVTCGVSGDVFLLAMCTNDFHFVAPNNTFYHPVCGPVGLASFNNCSGGWSGWVYPVGGGSQGPVSYSGFDVPVGWLPMPYVGVALRGVAQGGGVNELGVMFALFLGVVVGLVVLRGVFRGLVVVVALCGGCGTVRADICTDLGGHICTATGILTAYNAGSCRVGVRFWGIGGGAVFIDPGDSDGVGRPAPNCCGTFRYEVFSDANVYLYEGEVDLQEGDETINIAGPGCDAPFTNAYNRCTCYTNSTPNMVVLGYRLYSLSTSDVSPVLPAPCGNGLVTQSLLAPGQWCCFCVTSAVPARLELVDMRPESEVVPIDGGNLSTNIPPGFIPPGGSGDPGGVSGGGSNGGSGSSPPTAPGTQPTGTNAPSQANLLWLGNITSAGLASVERAVRDGTVRLHSDLGGIKSTLDSIATNGLRVTNSLSVVVTNVGSNGGFDITMSNLVREGRDYITNGGGVTGLMGIASNAAVAASLEWSNGYSGLDYGSLIDTAPEVTATLPSDWGKTDIKGLSGSVLWHLDFGSYLRLEFLEERYAGIRAWLRLVFLYALLWVLVFAVQGRVTDWAVAAAHTQNMTIDANWAGSGSLLPGVNATAKLLKVAMFVAAILLIPSAAIVFMDTIAAIIGTGGVSGILSSSVISAAPTFVKEMGGAVNEWFPLVELALFTVNYIVFMFSFDGVATLVVMRVRTLPI